MKIEINEDVVLDIEVEVSDKKVLEILANYLGVKSSVKKKKHKQKEMKPEHKLKGRKMSKQHREAIRRGIIRSWKRRKVAK